MGKRLPAKIGEIQVYCSPINNYLLPRALIQQPARLRFMAGRGASNC